MNLEVIELDATQLYGSVQAIETTTVPLRYSPQETLR